MGIDELIEQKVTELVTIQLNETIPKLEREIFQKLHKEFELKNEKLISMSELMESTGRSRGTLEKWRDCGYFNYYRDTPNGHYKYRLSEVMKYINNIGDKKNKLLKSVV